MENCTIAEVCDRAVKLRAGDWRFAGKPAPTSKSVGEGLWELACKRTRPIEWHKKRPGAAGTAFSDIRDPHRVSQETEAPGDARASGTDAGQSQNAVPAGRGRVRALSLFACKQAPTSYGWNMYENFTNIWSPSFFRSLVTTTSRSSSTSMMSKLLWLLL